MSQFQNLKIIAFVGLTGSGKSAAVEYLTKKGYPRVYFGGVIYKAMTEAGIEITPESQQIFRKQIREREGKDFVVKRIIDEVNDLAAAGQHRIVADGIYTWTEYKEMKHAFPGELTTVAVISPKHLRYRRLAVRPDRPFTEQQATTRDWSEIEDLEKGGPIAIADYSIMNDSDLENLYKQIDQIVEHIDF